MAHPSIRWAAHRLPSPCGRHERLAGEWPMIDHRQAVESPLERPSATLDARAKTVSAREEILPNLPSLRERTRAANHDLYRRSPMHRLENEFRCECGRPDCRVR